MSEVHGAFKDIMKITIRQAGDQMQQSSSNLFKRFQKSYKIGQSLDWCFELSTECPEFAKFGDLTVPITINKVSQSWIPKLRQASDHSGNVEHQSQPRADALGNKGSRLGWTLRDQYYQDVLQVNFED